MALIDQQVMEPRVYLEKRKADGCFGHKVEGTTRVLGNLLPHAFFVGVILFWKHFFQGHYERFGKVLYGSLVGGFEPGPQVVVFFHKPIEASCRQNGVEGALDPDE